MEAKLRAIGWLKSSYCMKKVDFSDFFEVIVHFCFLLKVISWSEGCVAVPSLSCINIIITSNLTLG